MLFNWTLKPYRYIWKDAWVLSPLFKFEILDIPGPFANHETLLYTLNPMIICFFLYNYLIVYVLRTYEF